MNAPPVLSRLSLSALLILFALAALAAIGPSPASGPVASPDIRWESRSGTWLFTIRFDHPPVIQATDRHIEMGYYYLDCARESGPAPQADWPFKSAQVNHVRRIYYPEQKVLRFVFYVPRGSNVRIERSMPTPTICQVTIAPLVATALGPSAPAASPPARDGQPRRRVIIDPGHGGWPTEAGISEGAQTTKRFSSRRYHEKDITLPIANYLEQYVKRSPNLDAVMTRREDVYVSLDDRVRIANEARGDVFISIHLNATGGRRKTRGFEIYYLNNETRAVDHQLLAMDNDEKVHLDQKDSSGETLRELLRMLAGEKFPQIQAESRDLCNVIVEEFRKAGPFRHDIRGVKSAAFRVLLNFNMPAALAECGFLDSDDDARLLIKAEYQKQIAALLFNGINRYFAVVDPKFTAHVVKVE